MGDAPDNEDVDVVVIGGGLAGLSAAITAADAGRRVVLLDARPLGGRARSENRNGHTFNLGPHALYVGGPGHRLLRGFGIDPAGAPPAVHGSLGLRRGRTGLLPSGPLSLLRTDLLRPRSKARVAAMLARLQRIRAADHAHQTVNGWLSETGLPADAAALVHLLVRVSTYVDAPDLLSAEAAIGQVQLAMGKGVRYLDGGWGSMADRLAQRARRAGADLRTGVIVRHVGAPTGAGRPSASHRLLVETSAGPLLASAVVLAVGTPAATAAVLGTRPTSWDRLGPEVAATSLDLGLARVPDRRAIFGVDEPVYWSVHGPGARLAPDGGAVAHAMRYLPPGDDPATAEEHRARLEALARTAGVRDADIVESRFLRRMVVTGGLPTAAAGGLWGRPDVTDTGRPGVYLAGDWVGPDGMLADAALMSGARAAERVLAAPVPAVAA